MSDRRQNLSRRRLVAGAGTVGALAAAAAVLPAHRQAAAVAAKGSTTASPDAAGYRETEHVLRYYQTARV